mmetsp:Transcript_134952/g.234630  ORF Transcript_134952/g.234630 Transcript_134952/m.234630 type:complete len:518 (-) Transcript_134952:141-1694(-)
MAEESADLEWLSDYIISVLKSPTWVVPIARFVDEQCEIFDDSEENKLEYTTCHTMFRTLVSDLLTAHLLEVAVTPEQFDRFFQNGLAQHTQLHRSLAEQLLSVDDFLTFKAMMTKQNAELERQVITLDAAECDVSDSEPASPTKEMAQAVIRGTILGGVAEADDWHLYDTEDADLKAALEASKESHAASAAVMRCEEAELEHAIALSLQLEEERLRQIEEIPCEPVLEAAPPLPPAAGFRSAPLTVLLPRQAAEETRLVTMEPLARASEAVVAAPAPPPLAAGFTSMPLAGVPPKLKLPAAELGAGSEAAKGMRLQLNELKVRADRIMTLPSLASPKRPYVRRQEWAAAGSLATPVPPAIITPAPEAPLVTAFAPPVLPAATPVMPPAAAAPWPSEAERAARAAHLKAQRDKLIRKRNQERDRQLADYQQKRGAPQTGVDAAWSNDQRSAMSRRLVAQSTPGAIMASAAAPPVANTAQAAEQVRQTLTLQLRQTFVRSQPTSSLDDQLSKLETMKAR